MEGEYAMRLRLQIATLILIAANACGCARLAQSSSGQRNNPPKGWQPVTLRSVTVYVPEDMTEQETAEKNGLQRIFDNGKLSISVGYSTAGLDNYMQIISGKTDLKEETSQIDGKKVNLFTFV